MKWSLCWRASALMCCCIVAATAPNVLADIDGTVAKAILKTEAGGDNRLSDDAWRPWHDGFVRQGDMLVCDNGDDGAARRGVGQTIVLDQQRPTPIVATAWSKAKGVGGTPNSDYAVYLDLVLADGTHLWGQATAFDTGTHDWQRREVVVVPPQPVRQVSFWLLLRRHAGKAWFRQPELREVRPPRGAFMFDGLPVVPHGEPREGFQLRDVAGRGDFVHIEREALGVQLDCRQTQADGATFFDVTLRQQAGRDRALTLAYNYPVGREHLRWLADPRRSVPVEAPGEYATVTPFPAVGRGRLSRWPLAAVADARRGTALAIDMRRPAFYRLLLNTAAGELVLLYDVALTAEKPEARVRFCRYEFDPAPGFRAALARYYTLFPNDFRCRTPRQGLWMPFAKISEVPRWEDFGFQFKEGTNETAWDDAHRITTFRYTEPMTWWMPMPPDMPRTLAAAMAEARRRADDGDRRAAALLTSGFHDRQGRLFGQFRDTPWCNGIVWSMNSTPGPPDAVTDFANKWNPQIIERLYGPKRPAELDGEYVDSSEGYATAVLDFRRDHFAATDTPLCFCSQTHQVGIFRGLVAFEYVRGIARDVHGRGKLMMANGAPTRLCWLTPMLEVLGTETNWNPGGRWTPMSDAEMLYRRALCKGKPYCFLMNTAFEDFSHELVERYMQRCVAYGMFPGFFSHNAAEGHYFTRPELYQRDRPLFKRYVPLCRLLAEAGWAPITRAETNDERVYVERFGQHYLTVFNDTDQPKTVSVRLHDAPPETSRELLTDRSVHWQDGTTRLTLPAEAVRVIRLR